MENDHEMVIRMFAYDVHFAITHAKGIDGDTGEITLKFPHSVVIYPAKNNRIPDQLQCRDYIRLIRHTAKISRQETEIARLTAEIQRLQKQFQLTGTN